MRPISSIWIKHLPGEKERAAFEDTLRRSLVVLSRLRDILDEELTTLEEKEFNPSTFTEPSWPYNEAYILGQKYRIKKLKDLLNFF